MSSRKTPADGLLEGAISLRARVESAQNVKGLLYFGRTMKTSVRGALEEIERKAHELYYHAAPYRTGRLGRGIRIRQEQGRALAGNTGRFSSGINFAVTVEAKNPRSGFDYVAATRFGHEVSVIRPVRAPELVFRTRKGWVRTQQVIPKTVTSDWAEAPSQEVARLIDKAAGDISRKLGKATV